MLLNGSNRKYAIISCCFLAGETALHLACIRNDAEKVEEILKQGCLDVNTRDHAGWTALHEAANRGHVESVKKILQYHGMLGLITEALLGKLLNSKIYANCSVLFFSFYLKQYLSRNTNTAFDKRCYMVFYICRENKPS